MYSSLGKPANNHWLVKWTPPKLADMAGAPNLTIQQRRSPIPLAWSLAENTEELGDVTPVLAPMDNDTYIDTWDGFYPADIDKFDFTHQEDECLPLLYGRDDRFAPINNSPVSIEVPFGTKFYRPKLEISAAPISTEYSVWPSPSFAELGRQT